ncbi:hypothetical protein BKA64DRAFT_656842 [Cadophora sp. MPI-SDFR-AT-0126]|nr:hypothetical protein BKA64DRAFT_656842 [Leotiomycetes sp. MPI-SDFR-AT-0126]
MGLMTYFSSFLLASQTVVPLHASTRNFTLQVWLDNFPLNHQYISWFPIPDKPGRGYFGIPIRSPAEPLPLEDRAVFAINSSSPGSLSFSSLKLGDQRNVVFVQQSGEVEFGAEIPVEFFKPYTRNFTTVDFTHWPDLETIHALDFTPPELILGMFLACPRELGDGKEKGYRLMAMTRMFKHPGCITLDWLVQEDLTEDKVDSGESEPIRDSRAL